MKIVKEHVQQFFSFQTSPSHFSPFGILVKVNQSVSGVEKSETHNYSTNTEIDDQQEKNSR